VKDVKLEKCINYGPLRAHF